MQIQNVAGHKEDLWKLLYSVRFFCGGVLFVISSLIPCHLIFTCFMHRFNRSLSVMAECAFRSGFVLLPGPATYPSPNSWISASGTALFFTLTIGSLSYSTGDLWAGFLADRVSSLKARFFASACFFVCLSLMLLSADLHFVFPASFLVTGVLAAFLRILYFKGYELRKRMGFILICFIGAILVVLSVQGSGFFAGIRDRLFFGTSAGEEIIDFYYKYNLFAAEVVKKPEFRIVKAVRAAETDQASVFEEVKNVFENKGFAFIKGDGCKAFYDVSLKKGIVEILSDNRLVFSARIDSLRSDPAAFFREFYSRSDNAESLRFMVFASFCFGIPLIFAGLLADSFLPLASSFNKRKVFALFLIIVCFTVSLFFANQLGNRDYSQKELKNMLESSEPEKRITAMDFIIKKKMDPDEFILPDVAPGRGAPRERILYLYLVSRSGGIDRFETISTFVDDPYPYVSCQATRFLSQLGDSRSVPVFEKILRTNSNFYVQLTALEALKSWKNRKTK